MRVIRILGLAVQRWSERKVAEPNGERFTASNSQ